ncbi:hypothetical protein SUBVAR_07229 [Subdoligranulum variabile DSM 15176]|uniref:Uncharacterized protein n=1 Tax=Subdoligranulum variabile DSM 15176 TaxID=411471 RepID=D1PS46_9FIRM|nr:hypothetical protein SUBVAR_07229 [Subdoligranulum variabile DSM 15176]
MYWFHYLYYSAKMQKHKSVNFCKFTFSHLHNSGVPALCKPTNRTLTPVFPLTRGKSWRIVNTEGYKT